VPQDSFALSAYRLSLLGLIGDAGAENRNGVSASLAQLPMHWQVGTELETVRRAGVAAMSRGRLQPVSSGDASAVSRSDAGAASAVAKRTHKPDGKQAAASKVSSKTKAGKAKSAKPTPPKTTTRKTTTRKSGNA